MSKVVARNPLRKSRLRSPRPVADADEAVLPSRDRLLAAIVGNPNETTQLGGWARELGDLYAALIPACLDPTRCPAGFDEHATHEEIARLVAQIDSWARRSLPRARGTSKHTHSFGEVISHIAETYADVWWIVLHTENEEQRHEAWFHFSEVCDGYRDLVVNLESHRVQLPIGWRGQPSGHNSHMAGHCNDSS